MKNFLIGTIIIIFTIILLNGLFYIQREFFPASEIGQENYSKLFEYCSTPIPVDKYPKTIKELEKSKYYDGDKNLLYDALNKTTEAYLKETELFALLGDKVTRNNKNSFSTNFYKKERDIKLYYNYKGDLMMIEKGSNINTQMEFKFYHCRYTPKGNLIEAIFSNKNNETHFNSAKKMIYSMTFSRVGIGISENYTKYIID